MSGSCCTSKQEIKINYRDKIIMYRPLIVIVGISVCVAIALSTHGVPLMNGMMGAFLLFLSSLKLFNLSGFADGFARYDVVAARSQAYAIAYPFIELGLGLFYLSGLLPVFTNIAALIVMGIGTIGVAGVIRAQSEVKCACVGAGFNLPVGYVTLAENLAMFAMAAVGLMKAFTS
jgi:hypothetical protein